MGPVGTNDKESNSGQPQAAPTKIASLPNSSYFDSTDLELKNNQSVV